MSKQQVTEIIKWLEYNHAGTTLTLEEVKELIEIERTAEPGVYGAWAENLPQSVIDNMEKELKDSGEYKKFDGLTENWKQKIENRLQSKN